MSDERTYIVTYDIADSRRWRRVFKTMNGFGEWLQLSVFQCRLSKRRRAELEARLRDIIKVGQDHVMVIDIGPADKTDIAIMSIGKPYATIERQAIVI
ncbi:MAG: CRISPR-associated protein Cas2 [Candidatus Synechococcus spongiarum 142]|uniref:CRISPR-associated endoribonuclease Cas2 n=1 Tax=Candidatus Synechococcus spongiarum 142 TaxID=1608213 RepID=A0A6N3X9A0_9SYNE|nr:MAG: CRISPR-associated protein Cas2 [Candidatus Synechococcus spongiarum 142]